MNPARSSALRGWILLEMTIALTVFVFSAFAILGAMGQGVNRAERTRDQAKAVELARSALAKLEAGLGTPQNLAGPVPAWTPESDPGESFDENADVGFDESLPEPTLWEIEIDTLPSDFAGLTHVSVTAVKRPTPESDRVTASFTLHQLVRLSAGDADVVGDLDDISREAGAGVRSSPGLEARP